jgi:MoaA/NifB/PqqE/SkfB family radical SAM enzyme
VVSSRNLRTITDLVELADGLGVYVLIQPYHGQKTGGATHIASVPVSVAETLVEMRRGSASMLNSESYLRALPGASTGETPARCQAGRKYFSIDPFGYLHPCVDTPAVGRVLDDDISVILSDAALAAVRSCPGCWYCFRGEADCTLSPGGCLEKMGLGFRILRRNAERNRKAGAALSGQKRGPRSGTARSSG